MKQTGVVLHLTEHQLPHAMAILGRAFQHDPLSLYVYPDESERSLRLPFLLSIPLSYAWHYGEVMATPDGTGVSCWLPPGQTTVSNERMARVGAQHIVSKLGLAGIQRFNAVDERMGRMHQQCLTESHWYLWILGVDPVDQGRGIGGALLRAGLERVDASGLQCYLETTNPDNVALYQKFGFSVKREEAIPTGEVHLWGMVRPAHSR